VAIDAPDACNKTPGKVGTSITRWQAITLPSSEEGQANARLIAAAPDHALFASAIAAGVIRWEMFDGKKDSGEICVNGLRWATQLDEFGVPVLTQNTRAAIAKAKGERDEN
jgi:hypothetical protein